MYQLWRFAEIVQWILDFTLEEITTSSQSLGQSFEDNIFVDTNILTNMCKYGAKQIFRRSSLAPLFRAPILILGGSVINMGYPV